MASLRGYVARFGARATARLLGVSDSTVRTALGGNQRKDRAIPDETRERKYIELNTRLRQLTGNTPPSRLQRVAPPPPVQSTEVLAGGDRTSRKHALLTGAYDEVDANGNIVGKPVRKVVHDTGLAHLLAQSVAEFGHTRKWAIAFFGEFYPTSSKYTVNTKGGAHRGWFTRKIEGDPSGNEHPAVRLAREIRDEIETEIRNLPKGITGEVDRKAAREIRGDYVNRFAEAINGQRWAKVHAIWIAPAKEY